MLNNDTPVGAPNGVPTPEDSNAASRAGDAASGKQDLGVSAEDEPKTSSPEAEGSSDYQPQTIHDEAIGWLVGADR